MSAEQDVFRGTDTPEWNRARAAFDGTGLNPADPKEQ